MISRNTLELAYTCLIYWGVKTWLLTIGTMSSFNRTSQCFKGHSIGGDFKDFFAFSPLHTWGNDPI